MQVMEKNALPAVSALLTKNRLGRALTLWRSGNSWRAGNNSPMFVRVCQNLLYSQPNKWCISLALSQKGSNLIVQPLS